MDFLKLVALDDIDLGILSAHLQDAVVKVGDLAFEPSNRRFAVACNRFVWENETRRGFLKKTPHERRRSILHFDRVQHVRAAGINRGRPDDVLSLLALNFIPAEETPTGCCRTDFLRRCRFAARCRVHRGTADRSRRGVGDAEPTKTRRLTWPVRTPIRHV